MPDHILSDSDILVRFPIVYLKADPNKAGNDGARARLRFDRWQSDAWFGLLERNGYYVRALNPVRRREGREQIGAGYDLSR